MVTAGDFKNGITFEMDGGVYQVIEFQHVKPGKGAAFVRTKIKTLSRAPWWSFAHRCMKTPISSAGICSIPTTTATLLLYGHDDLSLSLNKDKLPDSFKFVKEEMLCKIISYKGNVFGGAPDLRRLKINDTRRTAAIPPPIP